MKIYVSIMLFAGFCQNVAAQLNGTYTIGGVNPDYPAFAEALGDLHAMGVAGPVTFLVRDGVYSEQLFVHPIAGASDTDRITFASESNDSSAVILSAPGNNIVLDSAEYVEFKHITLHATGTALSRLVFIRNTTGHILFENCVFEGFITSSVFDSRLVECYGSDANSYMVFRNNRFISGQQGIFLYGDGAFINATYNVLEGNDFVDQNDRGIICQIQAELQIRNNRVSSTSTNVSYNGIYLQYCQNNSNVLANRIICSTGSGIYVNNSDGNGSNPLLVANNMVSNGCAGPANSGIRVEGSNHVRTYFNSVNMHGTDPTSAAFRFSANTTDLLNRLRGNSLRNGAMGAAVIVSGTTLPDQSDNNDLYTNGTTLAYFNGDQADLASWQSASGRDLNSVSVEPMYVNDTDLHLTSLVLNGLAVPLFGVDHDFDGDPRDPSTPDIGADEVDSNVGFEWITANDPPLLYPNPTTGLVHISGAAFHGSSCTDLSGRSFPVVPDRAGHTLDLSPLPSGLYFLRFGTIGGSAHKVIKR